MKNCANLLPLKSKLPGKFYRFNSTDRGIEMLETAEFGKKRNKMRDFIKFYETQTVISTKETIQTPLSRFYLITRANKEKIVNIPNTKKDLCL